MHYAIFYTNGAVVWLQPLPNTIKTQRSHHVHSGPKKGTTATKLLKYVNVNIQTAAVANECCISYTVHSLFTYRYFLTKINPRSTKYFRRNASTHKTEKVD